MGDPLISALFGSAQIQAVVSGSSMEGTAKQIPPEVASMPQGSQLKGFVINRTDRDHPVLRTPMGDVVVKSEVFLKTGSEVVLRISQQSGKANAQIISIDSVPIKTLIEQQNLIPAKTDIVQSSTITLSRNSQQPLQSPIVEAVALKLAQFGNEAQTQQTISSILRLTPAQTAQIEQGLTLQFRVTSGTIGTPQTSSPASTLPLNTQAQNTGQTTSTKYGAYSNVPTAAANTITTNPQLPGEQIQRAGTLSARVIGHEGNETIVRTSIGTIKLFTPAPLPNGSQIQLELLLQPTNVRTATTPTTTPSSTGEATPQARLTIASQFAQSWDSLEEAHHLLQPQGVAQASNITSRIPNTKSETVNNVLFFLSALRGNDLQRFFGKQQTQMLEELSPKLLQRLGADFSSLRAMSTEQSDTNWQMLFFPLMHDDEMHQARLYIRRDAHEDQPQPEEETRFVLEVELSELGEIQIDGLMHGSDAQKLFDITIRSEKPMENQAKEDLRELYRNAASAVGFSGQMRFASGAQNMLHPMQEIRAESAPTAGSILA